MEAGSVLEEVLNKKINMFLQKMGQDQKEYPGTWFKAMEGTKWVTQKEKILASAHFPELQFFLKKKNKKKNSLIKTQSATVRASSGHARGCLRHPQPQAPPLHLLPFHCPIFVHPAGSALASPQFPHFRACVPSHYRRVQLCATPWTVARQAPLPMVILQARILEWIAMPSSRRSS